MKKIIALILSLILLCGIFAVSASAATNYCEEFNTAVKMLCWWIEGNEVKEGEDFPVYAVIQRTLFSIDENKYAIEKNGDYVLKTQVPAADFEGVAAKHFAKFSTADLHADESYDEAKNAYIFDMGSGRGSLFYYCVYGYTGTNKYTVYSAFIDGSKRLDSAPAGKTEGKDYIREGDKFYLVIHWLKTVVEKGDEVKFHSWEKVASIPDVSLVRNEKTLEKKPEATSSQVTSSATSSETSSQATSSAVETSSQAESNATQAPIININQVIYVNIENVTIESVNNVFPEGTVVNVVMVTDEKQLKIVKTALKELTQKFVAYDITAKSENVTVQPDGTVKATFAIPEGYDHNKVGVVYVSEKGKTEVVPSVVNKETGKVVASLSHFSTYAVVEIENADSLTTGAKAQTAPIIWVLIFIAIVAALCGGFAAWYFLYFKKKGVNIAE